MARAYTVATSALALGLPTKWIDNILSHHDVAGVAQHHQGVARRLGLDALIILALTSVLIQELGISVSPALAIATSILENNGSFESPRGIRVNVDLPSFRAQLIERLANAVEIAPVPRRGRPPANKTGRLD